MSEIKTAAEKAEDRAIRRRWITIGEGVAVAGVLIAAGSLYLSWSEKREASAEKQAERSEEARKTASVTFVGRARGDSIALEASDHLVEGIEITFPRSLGIPSQLALAELRIAKKSYEKPILQATDGGPDRIEGRLPVLLTTAYMDRTRRVVDKSIYDILFVTEGHMLGGRSVRPKRLVLRERVDGADATARLDQLWAAEAKRLAELKKK